MIKVNAIGRTSSDIKVTNFSNGGIKVTFSLAVNESWIDKLTGEKREKTEWLKCQATGKLAENLANLQKGELKEIAGALKTESFTGDNGQTKYKTYVQLFTCQAPQKQAELA